MARTDIPVGVVSRSAATAKPAELTADVVNGNSYTNGPMTFVTVRNAHATLAKNVTVSVPVTVDGVTTTVVVQTYPIPFSATVTYDVGPFPADKYGSTILINGETTDIKFVARRLKG